MPPEIRLIATDLDGTLIGSANDFPLYLSFNEKVNELRAAHNASWAACTGRTFRSFKSFFYPMRTMGLTPDYVVTGHSYIYRLTRFGYMPHVFWDIHIHFLIWLNKWYGREAIRQWHELMTASSLGVMTVRRSKDRLWVRFDSPESARTAAQILRARITPHQHLKVFNHYREVEVHPVPFTKGLAVAELARHLNCGAEKTLTIGNGYNDLSMLQPAVAGYTGCPSNSDPEVLQIVHDNAGHVSGKRSLAGVMDILDAYTNDTVCSDLPENWRTPKRPFRPRLKQRHAARHHASRIRWAIIAAVVYVVLVVFASFDTIPFAGVIMKPWRRAGALLTRLIVWP